MLNQLIPLIQSLAHCLTKKRWLLVTAESCTGGLVASHLTELPGSSVWFERGFVTYSNKAKQEMLKVPEDLLIKYGAVSEPVACAMAQGALANSAGQVALSITGIAGPDGGSRSKLAGTVCFAWAVLDQKIQSTTRIISGNRTEVRQEACFFSLQRCLDFIP